MQLASHMKLYACCNGGITIDTIGLVSVATCSGIMELIFVMGYTRHTACYRLSQYGHMKWNYGITGGVIS